jgi:hypothetical protein
LTYLTLLELADAAVPQLALVPGAVVVPRQSNFIGSFFPPMKLVAARVHSAFVGRSQVTVAMFKRVGTY